MIKAVRFKITKRTALFFIFCGLLTLTHPLRAEEIVNVSYADLKIEFIQFQPNRLSTKTDIHTSARIRNDGTKSASDIFASIKILAYVPKIRQYKMIRELRDVPMLSSLPKGGMGLSLPVRLGRLPAGQYRIRFDVDAQNQILESDELNNSSEKDIEVIEA